MSQLQKFHSTFWNENAKVLYVFIFVIPFLMWLLSFSAGQDALRIGATVLCYKFLYEILYKQASEEKSYWFILLTVLFAVIASGFIALLLPKYSIFSFLILGGIMGFLAFTNSRYKK